MPQDPHPPQARSFPPAPGPGCASDDPARIRQYHRQKLALQLAGIPLSLAYWAACCIIARPAAELIAALDPGRWAGLLLLALLVLGGSVAVHLPLDYYDGFVVEHRFGLSNQTFRKWLRFQATGWLVGAVVGTALLVLLYGTLWYGGRFWGVWLWAGALLLTVVLARLVPLVILPLFYPSRPLDRPGLVDRLNALAAGSGMRLAGVFDLGLSEETKKANAMLAGLGSTRRVYLSDTLLESFDEREIGVVFAHELGHHVRRHVAKRILLVAAISSVHVALICWLLAPHAGGPPEAWVSAAAALPGVMLLTTVYNLLVGPLVCAVGRRFERQADRYALQRTGDPEAFRSAFERLSRQNLADPNPPRWEEILLDDHPALSRRIAMAEAYAREER